MKRRCPPEQALSECLRGSWLKQRCSQRTPTDPRARPTGLEVRTTKITAPPRARGMLPKQSNSRLPVQAGVLAGASSDHLTWPEATRAPPKKGGRPGFVSRLLLTSCDPGQGKLTCLGSGSACEMERVWKGQASDSSGALGALHDQQPGLHVTVAKGAQHTPPPARAPVPGSWKAVQGQAGPPADLCP